MKTRHASFIPGTLTAAYSGHVHAISIAGLATPPDLDGHYPYPGSPAFPICFHDTGSAYGHCGLQLTNAAGERDVVDYTSWTEAAGVYSFVVDATLAHAYVLGDAAGPLNSACLRRADGAKPILPYHDLQGSAGLNTRKSLQIQDYVDGFFGAVCGECRDLSGRGYPLWNGQFAWLSVVPSYHSGSNHYSAGYGPGMCGNIYIAGAAIYHYRWQHSAETRWNLGISCWGWGWVYKELWSGYKACEGGDPRGTYVRDSGCGAPTALVIEEVP